MNLAEKVVSPHEGLVPSLVTRRALISTFHCLAFITTIVRLIRRVRIRRLWWDDFWATVALLNAILVCIVFFLKPYYSASDSVSFQIFGDIGNVMFYIFGLWCAKLSMAVTLVRLLPPGRFKNVSKAMAVFFGLVGVTLSIQRVFGCKITKPSRRPCIIKPNIGYVEIVFDLVSDIWLIGAPFYMMWQLRRRLSRQRWRLFSAAFGCEIFSTAASVVHDVYLFRSVAVIMGLTAHIQLGVTITVCNILVLATSFYRIIRDSGGDSTELSDSIYPMDNGRGRFATVSTPRVPSTSHVPSSGTSGTDIISFTELGSSMMQSMSGYDPSSHMSNISKGS